MVRNLEEELDELRKEMGRLRKLVEGQNRAEVHAAPAKSQGAAEAPPPFVGHIAKMSQSPKRTSEDPECLRLLSRLEDKAGKNGLTGGVAYVGLFASAGRQSTWVREEVDTDALLRLMENGEAGTVLKSIGSAERLEILLKLLKKPMTATELIAACGFGSTGQVYHHLRPLIAADLVEEDCEGERGVYAVKPHRVQGIIMLLCGIGDLVDSTYGAGEWKEAK